MNKRITLPQPLFVEHGKRAVILLHAYTGSPNDVRMLCRAVENENYTVYSPMFSGHGTLDPQDILKEGPQKWYQDTKEAIVFLKSKGYDEIAILGLSMGGIMALTALTEKDLGLVGGGAFCSPIFPTKTNVYHSFLEYAKKVMAHGTDTQEMQAKKYAKIIDVEKQQLREIDRFSQQTSERLKMITTPIFLAQGALDEMIDPVTVFETIKGLKQTKLTLQWYPKSGHVVTVGPERKQFEKDVSDFLNKLPWSKGE